METGFFRKRFHVLHVVLADTGSVAFQKTILDSRGQNLFPRVVVHTFTVLVVTERDMDHRPTRDESTGVVFLPVVVDRGLLSFAQTNVKVVLRGEFFDNDFNKSCVCLFDVLRNFFVQLEHLEKKIAEPFVRVLPPDPPPLLFGVWFVRYAVERFLDGDHRFVLAFAAFKGHVSDSQKFCWLCQPQSDLQSEELGVIRFLADADVVSPLEFFGRNDMAKKVKVVRTVPKTVAEAQAMEQEKPRTSRLRQLRLSTTEELPVLPDGIEGSEEQDAIWREILSGNGHMIVNAFAGTGKTFTMVRGLQLMAAATCLPKYTNVAAFNRAVGNELKTKVPAGVRAGTLHAFGLGACSYVNRDVKIEQDKMDLLLTDMMGERLSKEDREAYYQILKLASLCKNTLAGEVWEEDGEWYFTVVPEVLDELCGKFDVMIEEGRRTFVYQRVEDLITASLRDEEYIDQDDMIWVPVVKNYKMFRANLLIVDEAQDLNACQQQLVLKAGDRLLLVGDKFQAIYGFRGADTHSIKTMADLLGQTRRGLTQLALTKTRRCPKVHVEYVKFKLKEIPGMESLQQFEALADAPKGILTPRTYDLMCQEIKATDMVVCRTNAPLVRLAYECIRRRKRVKIQGRDIGSQFKKLIETHSRGRDDISYLRENIEVWHSEQITKIGRTKGLVKRDRLTAQQHDKAMAIRYFINNSKSVKEILDTIEELFSERGNKDDFALLGTVHALKGMEAETVWVLGPEEMPHPMARSAEEIEQEWNLWYVAHTRSKNVMNLVRLPETGNVGRRFQES